MARLHVPAQEPCGVSALVHMCCADGHGACCCGSSVRAPCVLALQPICIFTTAICPRLMNVCSQKHGEMRKMEVKNLRKHVQRLPPPSTSTWSRAFCSWMGTRPLRKHGDNDSMSPRLWSHQTLFHFQPLLFQLPGLIPLTKP